MRILFKLTSRSRRTNFIRAIDSVIDNVVDKDNFHILVSLDEDDEAMKPLPVINCPHTYKVYKKEEGETITKISAINRDLNEFLETYDAQIIVNMSDDQVFTEKGFDDVIREAFKVELNLILSASPKYGYDIGLCLHFPDGNRNDLITMSIIGRDYYNRFKYIYHPDYISLYCDNEQTDVAKLLGCYKYVDKQIFEHLHPAYGKAIFDKQYQHTESFNNVDEQTYLKRKANNFYL